MVVHMAATTVAALHCTSRQSHMIQHNNDPVEHLLETKMPLEHSCRKLGTVERLTRSITQQHWVQSNMALSEGSLHFSLPDSDIQFDHIPLLEISHLVLIDGPERQRLQRLPRRGLEVERGKTSGKTDANIDRARKAEEEQKQRIIHELRSPQNVHMNGWLYKLNSDADPANPQSWRERLCEIEDGDFWYISHKTGGSVKMFAMTNVRDVCQASYPEVMLPHAFKVELNDDSSVTFAVQDEGDAVAWIEEIKRTRNLCCSQTPGLKKALSKMFFSSFTDKLKNKSLVVREESIGGNCHNGLLCDFDEDDMGLMLRVMVNAHGHNSGRHTTIRFSNAAQREEWLTALQSARTGAFALKQRLEDQGIIIRSQRWAAALYDSDPFQIAVGVVILSSFLSVIVSAEILPEEGSDLDQGLQMLEYLYTAIFSAELLLNVYGHWFWVFVLNGWNVFDSAIVVSMFISVSGNHNFRLSQGFRVLRVFRMIRLFQKLQMIWKLRVLVNALFASVVPLAYSFSILVLISSIYAVLATELFRPRGDYDTEQSRMFLSFTHSLFTLFQLATGDGWASDVTRGLMSREDVDGHGLSPTIVALFFVTYFLIVGVVLMNVVVAVLLDEFLSIVMSERDKKAAEEESELDRNSPWPLDPLIRRLLLGFVDQGDLSARIQKIFQRMDLDENGSISMHELNLGLKKILNDSNGSVRLTKEDYDMLTVTEHGKITNAHDEFDQPSFEKMMMRQLHLYSNRMIGDAIVRTKDDVAQTLAIKMTLLNLQTLQQSMDSAIEGGKRSSLQGLNGQLNSLVEDEQKGSSQIERLNGRIDSMREDIGCLREDLREQISDLRDDVSEILAFIRQQPKSEREHWC